MKKYIRASEEANGVFWVIDDELYAFPFYADATTGLAKSGTTYNHKNLWKDIAPSQYRNKSFDYFPRGRVEFKSNGQPIIYMTPHIDKSMIPEIKRQFGLRSEPQVEWDNSSHYRCYLDDDYIPQK